MSENVARPYLIHFEESGDLATGFLASTQRAGNLPFPVRRIFWTYGTPIESSRGGHANLTTQEVMVAIKGTVTVHTETTNGEQQTFTLNDPTEGLYIPANCWLTITCGPDTLLLCMASTDFDVKDYVRDLTVFRNSHRK